MCPISNCFEPLIVSDTAVVVDRCLMPIELATKWWTENSVLASGRGQGPATQGVQHVPKNGVSRSKHVLKPQSLPN